MLSKINCVICKKIIPSSGKIGKNEKYKSYLSVDELCASFKCIDASTSTVAGVWQDVIESESSGLSFPYSTIYCLKCSRRNDAVSEMFKQLEELQRKLENMKQKIIQDFKNSLDDIIEVYSSDDVVEVCPEGEVVRNIQQKLELVRNQLAKDLKFFTDEIDDYQDVGFYPDYDQEEENDEIMEKRLRREKRLLRKYRISESTVVIERLSERLVEIFTEKRCVPLPQANLSGGLKCPFEDCTKKYIRFSPEDLTEHLRNQHAFSEPEALELLEQRQLINKEAETITTDVQQSSESYRCTLLDCKYDETFDSLDRLKDHLCEVHEVVVSEGENDFSGDENEEEIQKDAGSTKYFCIFDDCKCKKMFTSKSELTSHSQEVHQVELSEADIDAAGEEKRIKPVVGPFSCSYVNCPFKKTFKTVKSRRKHAYKYHLGRKQIASHTRAYRSKKVTFLCTFPDCPMRARFKSEEEREDHVKWAHGSDPHLARCGECNKHFKTFKEKSAHRDAEHGSKFKHMCQFCGKGFKHPITLKYHLPKHTDETPHKCPHCPRAFRHLNTRDYHVRTTHTKEFRYNCDQCGEGFVLNHMLKAHMKKVHERDRSAICHVCGKSFATFNYMQTHVRKVHSRETKVGPVRGRGRPRKESNVAAAASSSQDLNNAQFQHPVEPDLADLSAEVLSICSNSSSAPVDLTQDYSQNMYQNFIYQNNQSYNRTDVVSPAESPTPVHQNHHFQVPNSLPARNLHPQAQHQQAQLSGFPGFQIQNQVHNNPLLSPYSQFVNNLANYTANNFSRH